MPSLLSRASEHRSMPWKNGQGVTLELAIEPPGASLATGFLWRLSMAEVGSSGPFSAFPGVDRTLLLLEGNGMELDFGPHGRQRLDECLRPVAFPGEWPAAGRLLDGPCRDFNVMTDRTRARHTARILELGAAPAPLRAVETTLLFCAQGRINVAPLGLRLERHDLLRLTPEEATGLQATALAAGSVLIQVDIERIAP